MLVLGRFKDEVVMIGDIEVMIVDVSGGRVKLGITAPPDAPVHRKEVYKRINGEKGKKNG